MAFTRPKAAQIDFDLTNITDTLIRINSAESGDNTNDLGIVFERGNHTNAAIVWDESADAFRMISTTHDASTTTTDINISAHHTLHVGGLGLTGNIDMGGNDITNTDLLRINQTGSGLRMTNVGAFDNDGSDNFRIFSTNDLQLKANGDSGGGLTIDATNQDVTIDNDLRVSAGQFYYGGTAVTSTATELNYVDGVTSNIQTQIDNISSSFTLAADSGTNDTFTTGQTLTIAGGTGIDTTVSDNNISVAIDSTVATLTGTQTLENKTLRAPTFESGSNAPEFLETRYVNATQMDFVQLYTGASSGSYFTQGEYQKVATIIPSANSQNYTFRLRMTATSASNYQIVEFTGALRSNTLPDLTFTSNYYEEHNGTRFIEPKLWTKETTTAGFILAFEYVHNQNLYGGVNVEATIIPRSDDQRANVTFNTTQNSEQSSIDAGYTENDPTLIYSNVSGTLEFGTQFRIEGSTADGNELTITATDPTADRTITFPDATGTVALTSDISLSTLSVTSTATELNLLDGASAGTVTASKAVIYDGNGGIVASGDINLNDADDQIVHGDTDYNQKQYVLYGTTTDATETEIFVGGTASSRVPVATDTTVFYSVDIAARRTDATGESGGWSLKAVADNFSGTVADVGSVYEIQVATDDADFAVDSRADNTNNAIGIHVTGAAGKTIRWTAIVRTFEVAQ